MEKLNKSIFIPSVGKGSMLNDIIAKYSLDYDVSDSGKDIYIADYNEYADEIKFTQEKLKEKFDIVIPDENTLCYDEGSEIDSMIQWANDKNIEFDVILSSLRKQGFKKSLQQMSFKLIKSGGSIKEQKWWSE